MSGLRQYRVSPYRPRRVSPLPSITSSPSSVSLRSSPPPPQSRLIVATAFCPTPHPPFSWHLHLHVDTVSHVDIDIQFHTGHYRSRKTDLTTEAAINEYILASLTTRSFLSAILLLVHYIPVLLAKMSLKQFVRALRLRWEKCHSSNFVQALRLRWDSPPKNNPSNTSNHGCSDRRCLQKTIVKHIKYIKRQFAVNLHKAADE